MNGRSVQETVQALLLTDPSYLDEQRSIGWFRSAGHTKDNKGDLTRAARKVRGIRIGAHLAAHDLEHQSGPFGWSAPRMKPAQPKTVPAQIAAALAAHHQGKAIKKVMQPSPAPKLEKPKS